MDPQVFVHSIFQKLIAMHTKDHLDQNLWTINSLIVDI